MKRTIRPGLPLITPCIKWEIDPPSPLPAITPRILFNIQSLSDIRKKRTFAEAFEARGQEISSDNNSGPKALAPASATRPRPRGPGDPINQDRPGPAHSPASVVASIAKLPGEPGRPKSGGYSLEAYLVLVYMTRALFEDFSAYTKNQTDSHLNVADSYVNQNEKKLKDVITEIRTKFPDLRMYEDDWSIRDILKGYLKYRSSRIQRGLEPNPNTAAESASIRTKRQKVAFASTSKNRVKRRVVSGIDIHADAQSDEGAESQDEEQA